MTKPLLLALTKSGVYPEPGSTVGPEVNGPAVSVVGNLPAFDSTDGGTLADSGVTMASVAELAHELVVGASTIALGTNSATAAVLPAATGGFYPVTAADDAVGVRLHANDKVLSRKIIVLNRVTNKILKVYPPTGGNVNSAGVDAAFSTSSGMSAVLICTDAVANLWTAYNLMVISNPVAGPASSTDLHIAVFSGASGLLLADGGALISALATAASVAEVIREQLVGASTVAAGTTTTDAGVLPAATGGTYPTTGANGVVGVRIAASDKVTGRKLFVANGAALMLKIYPPTGGTINGAGADAAFSTLAGLGATLVCTNSDANTWIALN